MQMVVGLEYADLVVWELGGEALDQSEFMLDLAALGLDLVLGLLEFLRSGVLFESDLYRNTRQPRSRRGSALARMLFSAIIQSVENGNCTHVEGRHIEACTCRDVVREMCSSARGRD